MLNGIFYEEKKAGRATGAEAWRDVVKAAPSSVPEGARPVVEAKLIELLDKSTAAAAAPAAEPVSPAAVTPPALRSAKPRFLPASIFEWSSHGR